MLTKQVRTLLALVLTIACSNMLCGEEPKQLYVDNFSDVAGSKLVDKSGLLETENSNTRTLHTFVGNDIVGGALILRALEDNQTTGPDDKPGVLAFCFDQVPLSVAYSGFVYSGRKDDPIKLPLSVDQASDQLKNYRLKFRYKATNAKAANIGSEWNVRLEWEMDDSYETRIDFGTLSATETWKTFDFMLSDGTNESAFLAAIGESKDQQCKLVWGQEGEVSRYDDGDVLLIDDIEVLEVK